MQAQLKALAARPHVVIATPGRLQVSAGLAVCLHTAKGYFLSGKSLSTVI